MTGRFLHVVRARLPVFRGPREEAILEAIERAGHSAVLCADGPPDAGPGDVLIMVGGAPYFPATFRGLLALPPDRRPLSVLWHTEPLPAPRVSGLRPARRHAREWLKIALRDPRRTDPLTNARALARLRRGGLPDVLVTSTPWRQTFLAEQSVEAEWVPLGHLPSLGDDLGRERDVDVVFVGSRDVPRRRRIIRRMIRAGIDVRAEGAWSAKGLWGDERTELLNRTKILLNLGRHPGELSGMRLLLGMANRTCVLSEPIWDPRPYVPGVHFAQAPAIEELPEAALALLEDDARRTAIADAGHAFALSLPFARSADRLVALAEAAPARRSGAPATPPAEAR